MVLKCKCGTEFILNEQFRQIQRDYNVDELKCSRCFAAFRRKKRHNMFMAYQKHQKAVVTRITKTVNRM